MSQKFAARTFNLPDNFLLMNNAVHVIPLGNLALTFIPVGIVIAIMLRWSLDAGGGLVAVARMLLQLLLIGFVLNWIFAAESPLIVLGLLLIMLSVASWISLRPLEEHHWKDFGRSFVAITLGGCLSLTLVVVLVLDVQPWYSARQVIPLAGMIFASSMNSVSIGAERLAAEFERNTDRHEARRLAYQASLIPLLNSLLAVGLVSLPGMMTGQILSGVEPLIAARYQIMVMCMLTGASGISTAIYLSLAIRHKTGN
jgi:putative ABC transport system permease protein